MIGWLQCAAGVSGDMLLGALVDVGVPLELLADAVERVAPERVQLRSERVVKAGIAATKVHVDVADSQTHRTWRDVRALVDKPDLPGRDQVLLTFERLAIAEAEVHGTTPEETHFHEVGALDSIADVVGVCAGFAHLGLERLTVSPVALGGGYVQAAHGQLAVPGPAVVRLLAGAPSYGGPVEQELTTPTGAALARTWASTWGQQPPMTVEAQGFGAGTRDLTDRANVVRLIIGSSAIALPAPEGPETTSLLLETNVDDLDGRIWPHVIAALLDAGAEDAWLVPILMKKGRSAHTLRVLTSAYRVDAIHDVIFRETSAIGLRYWSTTKHALDRHVVTADVDGMPIRIKVAVDDHGEVVNAQPEWADVLDAASQLGESPKATLARAVAAYWNNAR